MNLRLKAILEQEFGFRANQNQLKILERLMFEIMRREDVSQKTIISFLKSIVNRDTYQGRNCFSGIKNALFRRRFPLASAHRPVPSKDVYASSLRLPLEDNLRPQATFFPQALYVEREVKDSELAVNFKKRFPAMPLTVISSYRDYLAQHPYSLAELKKPIVFIVKEKWDFLKPCPCTKQHMGCGYWILNLGFGCPFDCSYCFLQHYTNAPGLTLAANLHDFFASFDRFEKKLKAPIRIGTGEFCDSLALDELTGYSKQLIPYFSRKKVLFEFKTKSATIANILTLTPAPNIVISWSINPAAIAQTEELAAAALGQRLEAAAKVQAAGFRVGFHFDPIIHSDNWQEQYRSLVNRLYDTLNSPFAWISLGTLRCNPRLKNTAELRFPESNIFYGELLLGEDRKLRYPKFLRKQIYENMIQWIRSRDLRTPLYLCMEGRGCWSLLPSGSSAAAIEKSLLYTW